MITIKDIARELSCSPSTVSMALNDNPRVSEKTKTKVKALAKKLQYHPDMIARAMVQKKTHMIGLIISDIMSSFFPQIIQGVEDIISELAYSAIICPTNGNPAREREYMRALREKRVDGIIAEPVENRENVDLWNDLVERKAPLISILNIPPVKGVCHIGVDNEKGGLLATEHLIRNNHKIIGHLAGPQYFQTGRERLRGFREALKTNDLPYYDNLILETTYDWEAGYNNMRILLQSNPRPTAVFCAGDIIAIGASFALRQSGFNVPDDIALVGYDDLFIASIAEIPLTTVAQPKYHLGSLAARKLMDMIAGKEVNSEILQPTLTIRQSCGSHKKEGAHEATAAEFKIQYQHKK
jgi:DNA-binding LacI/PurR family transcriptional regulator